MAKTILVVDDEPDIRLFLSTLLQKQGTRRSRPPTVWKRCQWPARTYPT